MRPQQNGKGGWTESASSKRGPEEGKELGTGEGQLGTEKEGGQRRSRCWEGRCGVRLAAARMS